VVEGRHAQVSDVVAFGEPLHRGELLVRGRQAGPKAGDLAEPALLAGFGDAIVQVGDDGLEPRRLVGVGPERGVA
jgi:hypothetical protein